MIEFARNPHTGRVSVYIRTGLGQDILILDREFTSMICAAFGVEEVK